MGTTELANQDETHVLIIEDDKQLRKLFRIIVENEGFKVTEAANGSEGIEKFKEQKCFRIVITDILMPATDGFEVIKKLKELCAGTCIIAVSGGNMVDSNTHLNMAKTLGASYVFPKPVNMDEFRKAIQSVNQ